MTTLRVTAAVVAALLADWTLAHAQLRGARGGKLYLVEAMCETSPGMGTKCNPTTFQAGSVTLRTAKQPLLYTATNPDRLTAATIKIKGLYPWPEQGIVCEEDATTTFGDDADGNCMLAGLRVYGPAAYGTLSCSAGDCYGTLYAVTTLPDGGCTDVKLTVERPEIACWTAGHVGQDAEKLVQNGLVVLPGKDCESNSCY
jgi:hypothetical protein